MKKDNHYFLCLTFLGFILFFARVNITNIYREIHADVQNVHVDIIEEDRQNINRVLEYYDKISRHEIGKDREKEMWISPENKEIFSSAFTDKDKFFELRKKKILNEENLKRITALIRKAMSEYDGKEISTMKFSYKDYEFVFPFSTKRWIWSRR